jgi:hypothetical protein
MIMDAMSAHPRLMEPRSEYCPMLNGSRIVSKKTFPRHFILIDRLPSAWASTARPVLIFWWTSYLKSQTLIDGQPPPTNDSLNNFRHKEVRLRGESGKHSVLLVFTFMESMQLNAGEEYGDFQLTVISDSAHQRPADTSGKRRPPTT